MMRTDFLVYLSGAVSHLTYDGAEDWRAQAKSVLADHHIKALSPLRGEAHLREAGVISPTGSMYSDKSIMSSPRGVLKKNHFDATRVDMMLVNLAGAPRPSLGTAMEIAWAYDRHIPIVMIMEEGNANDHMMINEAASFRVRDMDEAIAVIVSMADNYALKA